MFDDDGAAPVSLHAKIEPANHSSQLAPWVWPVSAIACAGLVAFGVANWHGAPDHGYVAQASTVPGAPSATLPPAPPIPSPAVSASRAPRAATPAPRVLPPPPAAAAPPPAAPAAPPTDSPEEAARKEDIKRGLDARHQNTFMAFDNGAATGPSGASGAAQASAPSNPALGSCNSGYALCPGDNVPFRWTVNVDSDVPGGLLRGEITQDVYDHTGTNVVLHAGGTLIGTAAAVDVAGRARMASAWTEVQDRGFEIPLDASGTGAMGESGLSANVDNHVMRAGARAALFTLVDGAGSALGNAFGHNGAQINFGTATQAYAPPTRPLPTYHIIAGTIGSVVIRSRVEVPH
jgi:type IV secretory pathway VirB10-like protein